MGIIKKIKATIWPMEVQPVEIFRYRVDYKHSYTDLDISCLCSPLASGSKTMDEAFRISTTFYRQNTGSEAGHDPVQFAVALMAGLIDHKPGSFGGYSGKLNAANSVVEYTKENTQANKKAKEALSALQKTAYAVSAEDILCWLYVHVVDDHEMDARDRIIAFNEMNYKAGIRLTDYHDRLIPVWNAIEHGNPIWANVEKNDSRFDSSKRFFYTEKVVHISQDYSVKKPR